MRLILQSLHWLCQAVIAAKTDADTATASAKGQRGTATLPFVPKKPDLERHPLAEARLPPTSQRKSCLLHCHHTAPLLPPYVLGIWNSAAAELVDAPGTCL